MAVTGNLYPFILQQAQRSNFPLSFLQDTFTDVEEWRTSTRDYLRSLLLYTPEVVELSPELVDHTEYPDYIQQKWYFTASPGERVPAILLLPRQMTGPTPAVLALHSHGAMYYFGKKKLVEEPNEPPMLMRYREEFYEGSAIANELVRRGYIVAVIDSFYFGERRMMIPPSPGLQSEFLLAAEGSDQWVELLNRQSAQMEDVVAKSLFMAGTTWPGILAWDDMRTVDFLLTRPEVDPARLGCVGLSMGGLRAALLSALDPRITATCIVGWMSTLTEMLEEKVALHSWVNFIPGLTRVMDWPDVTGLHAPNPLLVMQGSQDTLFPLDGYQKAAERLRSIYAKAGMPGNLDIGLFDVPHSFTREMQRQAWAFFDNAFDSSGEQAAEDKE
ncbi:MAG TPA: alpha/beta hydrolase family protein [Armatimonadota bacterium]|jgi:dienelactone hydrolase